jgi:aromatic ring-opening dioxygenase LigB subunit
MPLVIAAVAPHGFPLIPQVSETADGALATRAAMLEMGRRFKAAQLDAIVIAEPHGFRVPGHITMGNAARAAGTLHWEGHTVEMNLPLDLALTQDIVARARARQLPIAEVGFASSDPRASTVPIDWGSMTPLWFAGHDADLTGYGYVLAGFLKGTPPPSGPPVVLITPATELPREQNVAFGHAVAEAAEASGRRVGFIASCDWSHSHSATGPYGLHPAAKEMDARVLAAIRDNQPLSLIDLDDAFIRDAAIDGLWQLLMLGGALEVTPMAVDVLAYEAPSYYGMVVATYAPTDGATAS